jgi:hypothetical protein
MRTIRCTLALLPLILPAPLLAQKAAKPAPPVAQQITAAVLALPAEYRASARVMGYQGASSQLAMIREGKGPFTCLANDPAGQGFHVACYHEAMEPFMARGRALRASGVKGEQVDTVRFAEVKTGKIVMPKQPVLMYQLFGPAGAFDAATGTAPKAKPLVVVYMPGATAASTGLSTKPAEGTPWIMFSGTPKAHIMLEPKM